ncbi:transposase [Colletotrichum sojae]|uniref:Transposase n=1 Tax=Colletotrichum sojae TaxID=2175907 RepID=A0A8H6JK80_9PEZI|nr:transposase [Colletotrichum sojae]
MDQSVESRVLQAVQYLNENPTAKTAQVARQFEIPFAKLRYRLEGRSAKRGTKTANTKLSAPEEKALCRYIDRLDRINLAVRPEFVQDAANAILREKGDASTVNRQWVTRFLKRHNYTKARQKKLHVDRQASEDTQRVQKYFQQLQQTVQEYGVQHTDIWNMDETGFRIGVGKDQMITTRRKTAHYFALPENRESATAIEAISAAGSVIPAFLVLAGQLQERQAQHTPSPSPSSQGSHTSLSSFTTPVTLRQVNKAASRVWDDLEEEGIDPSTARKVDRFLRGAVSLATELVQTKRDLARNTAARWFNSGSKMKSRRQGALYRQPSRKTVQLLRGAGRNEWRNKWGVARVDTHDSTSANENTWSGVPPAAAMKDCLPVGPTR